MIEIDHLDLNIVRHCNMRCVSCSHVSPLARAWQMTTEMIVRDLWALKPILKPRSINVVGGEPTLHGNLIVVLDVLKNIRIDEKTVVITNGKILPRMTDEFWSRLECLKISIYGTTQPETLALAEEKCAEFKFELISESFPQFHVQFSDNTADQGAEAFSKCHWRRDCFTVHDGYFYLCPQSAFFHDAIPVLLPQADGLPLAGITEESLRAFMDRTAPFKACAHCAAWERYGRTWSESPRAEWVSKSSLRSGIHMAP